jgi:phosphatidylglycerophosphatase C
VTVAAFDFDGTLSTGDCVVPFLRRLAGWHGIVWTTIAHPMRATGAAARRDRDALKDLVVGGVFRGRSVDAVAAVGADFAASVQATRLRADTVARLRWHQRAGHRVVLVSASLGPYLRPLGDSLGVDGVVCTDVEQHGGTYGAALLGGNCRGPLKAERLARWREHHDCTAGELWAYGDSTGDRELLAMADRPVWVNGTTIAEAP